MLRSVNQAARLISMLGHLTNAPHTWAFLTHAICLLKGLHRHQIFTPEEIAQLLERIQSIVAITDKPHCSAEDLKQIFCELEQILQELRIQLTLDKAEPP